VVGSSNGVSWALIGGIISAFVLIVLIIAFVVFRHLRCLEGTKEESESESGTELGSSAPTVPTFSEIVNAFVLTFEHPDLTVAYENLFTATDQHAIWE
jgi:hypothetical protein